MQITETTPRKLATVGGKNVHIPTPFTVGHTLNSGEADAMNQLLIENVRNNIVSRAKAADEAKKPFDIQAEIDAYVPTYEFGARSVSARRLDPIDKIMHEIAKNKIIEGLRKKNIKVSDLDKARMEELINDYVQTYGDKLRPIAENRLKEEADIAVADISA